jgi:hypothetical protein
VINDTTTESRTQTPADVLRLAAVGHDLNDLRVLQVAAHLAAGALMKSALPDGMRDFGDRG